MWKHAFGLMALVTAGTSLALGQDLPTPPMPRYQAPMQNSSVSANGSSALTPNNVSPYRAYQADAAAAPATAADGMAGGNGGCGCAAERCLHGWFRAEYLMLFPNNQNTPVLVRDANTGAPLIGGSTNLGISNGVRINTGLLLCEERMAMQAVFFSTFRAYVLTGAAAGNFQLTDAAGNPTPLAVTTINSQTYHQINSAEGNSLLRLGAGDGPTKLYGLIGTRVTTLEEDIATSYNTAGGAFLDQFHTLNRFTGGQIGAILRHQGERVAVEFTAKMALGNNYTQLTVLGSNSAGAAVQALTGRSNIGLYETNYFSIIPEMDLNLALRLTERLSANVGYNFLMYTNTWRPGNNIVLASDGGVTQPKVPFNVSTYFLHGLNFGLTFRY